MSLRSKDWIRDKGDEKYLVILEKEPRFMVGRKSPSEEPQPEVCGVNLSDLKIGDDGFIKPPNYPGNYPPDIQCIWWL